MEIEVRDETEESLKRVCEFIVAERKAAMEQELPTNWHNRVSYLAHTTLRVYRQGVESHHELANLARAGLKETPEDAGLVRLLARLVNGDPGAYGDAAAELQKREYYSGEQLDAIRNLLWPPEVKRGRNVRGETIGWTKASALPPGADTSVSANVQRTIDWLEESVPDLATCRPDDPIHALLGMLLNIRQDVWRLESNYETAMKLLKSDEVRP